MSRLQGIEGKVNQTQNGKIYLRLSLSWAFCEIMRKMNQRLIVRPEGDSCFENPLRYAEKGEQAIEEKHILWSPTGVRA